MLMLGGIHLLTPLYKPIEQLFRLFVRHGLIAIAGDENRSRLGMLRCVVRMRKDEFHGCGKP